MKYIVKIAAGFAAAVFGIWMTLVQMQTEFSWELLWRPSWTIILALLGGALVVWQLASFMSSRQTHEITDESPQAQTEAPVPFASVTIPGVVNHGRLVATLKRGTPVEHLVTWKGTEGVAGKLIAGHNGHWDVYDTTPLLIGSVPDIASGLALIETVALNWIRKYPVPHQPKLQTLIDPSSAPRGKTPALLGIEYLEPKGLATSGQGYLTEAWQLTNGSKVVIVTDNGGTSLMNASEKIAAMIDERWGGPYNLTIIEEWDPPASGGKRFVESARNGGHWQVDRDSLAKKGIVLPQ